MELTKLILPAVAAAMLPLQSAAYETIKSETLRVWFDDITLVADGAADSGECYDLLGRKVANRPAAPGIYIRGGEKIVVK